MQGVRVASICVAVLGLAWNAHAQLPRPFLEKTRLDDPELAGPAAFGSHATIESNVVAVSGYAAPTPVGSGRGTAYLYERPPSGWTATEPKAQLYASDGTAGAEFGRAMAMQGDTLVIGARLQGSGVRTGAAYVFEKPASGWQDMAETAQLLASDGYELGNFGGYVGISGSTVFASFHRAPPNEEGAIYVFEKPSGGWSGTLTETAVLLPSDPVGSKHFGVRLTADADTVAVAHNNAIYIFEKPSSGWTNATETVKLSPVSGRYLSAWIDGDTLLVGYSTTRLIETLLVFEKGPGGWADATQVATLSGSKGKRVGIAVDLSQDRVISGSVVFLGRNLQEQVLVWEKPDSGWVDATETVVLRASDGTARGLFGSAVAIDGEAAVVTGGFGGPTDSGRAYVFDRPTVVPGSGCAPESVGLLGSTRIGTTMVAFQTHCGGDSSLGIAVGTPFGTPVRFANLPACGDPSSCLLSCKPSVFLSGVGGVLAIESSPSFVGTTFCVQGLCLDQTGCVSVGNMSLVTISQ